MPREGELLGQLLRPDLRFGPGKPSLYMRVLKSSLGKAKKRCLGLHMARVASYMM